MHTAFTESGVGKNFKSNLKTANPTLGKITMLSMYFNVSREYLMGESDKRGSYIRDVLEVNGIKPVKRRSIPILGSVACGEPIFADEQLEGYASVEGDINADFCLYAKGDSMIEAGIRDGSIVFVKKQPTVENGQIAVVLIDDDATLKRVYFDKGNRRMILNPANSSYAPIVVDSAQLESGSVRILGKAVMCQFRIN
ncbi:MAG: hypothetical protein IJW19_00585 [Clostridia bacterium]|nr:hypothetical protein [Clostridia bacterium]